MVRTGSPYTISSYAMPRLESKRKPKRKPKSEPKPRPRPRPRPRPSLAFLNLNVVPPPQPAHKDELAPAHKDELAPTAKCLAMDELEAEAEATANAG